MSTITKQWLQQAINDYESVRDEIPFGLDDYQGNILAALRIALASLEAEAVCVIDQSNLDYLKSGSDADVWPASRTEMGDVLLYRAAPPAPVSVPDFPEILPCPVMLEPGLRFGKGVPTKAMLGALQRRSEYCAELDAMTPEQRAEHDAGMKEFAAMLQGAEPVTTAYKLPANTPCKEAPEHIWLQTAGVWPENGEFSELTWCSDNQHPDDTLYVRADVVTGNSPVIPDGVCPCCGRKPLKNRTCSVAGCDGKHVARGFCIKHYAIERKKDPSRRESIRAADKRYRARKAAAPQQGVKP
ncbi:DUF551 domain-containing protein [Enterobacter hormaechei]